MKKIEIVITNNDGSTSVLASNADQNADCPGGTRVWKITFDSTAIRTLNGSDHWAASYMCKRAITELFMISPEDAEAIAMLAAFHATRDGDIEGRLNAINRTLQDVVKTVGTMAPVKQ